MKLGKKLLVLGFALISLVILPCLCSATMTVSIDTDKENYFVGNQVTFTGSVVIAGANESGCCNLNSSSLAIKDGSSKACELATEEGNYDSGHGNCSLVMKVTETHPSDCMSYGGDNTIEYVWVYWTVPSGWSTGDYTATITATACGTSDSESASFKVLTNSSSSDSDVNVTNQTTDETTSGLAEVDITIENSAGTAQNTTITVPIPDSTETVNLTLAVPGSGTRHIAALDNGLICSPESATIDSIDYSSSSKALTVELSGGGAQDIVVYVGDKGEPKSIKVDGTAVTSWTYSSTAKTVTFTATISCPDEIIVSWYVAPTTTTTIRYRSSGGGGGGGSVSFGKIKPSCFDGIKNCHDGDCEEGVDCGGPCKACPSCNDGIQNQGETGVDCGGPCPPCKITTTTVKRVVTTTTLATITTTTAPTTTTVVHVTLAPTTTIPPSPGIPLGMTEGVIILTAITLIGIAFMIQTGRI